MSSDAQPMQVAKLNEYGRERYLDTSKITNGNEKEFCNIKAVYVRSSQEIYNINPGYMHQPLIQTLQVCDPISNITIFSYILPYAVLLPT